MKSPGFEIVVDDFCQHCGEFEPECETIEVTNIEDAQTEERRFIRTIQCEHRCRCAAIKDFIRRNMENEQVC